LWAFAAYDLRNDRTPLHLVNEFWGLDRQDQIDLREHVHSLKLTFAARPTNTVTLSLFGNPSTTSGWRYGGNVADPSVALVTSNSGSSNLTLRDEAVLGGSSLVELIVGRHRQDQSTRPQSSVPMQGDFLDINHVFYHGGHPYHGTEKASRDFYALRGTQVFRRHEMRVGADYERNRYDQTLFFHAFWLDRQPIDEIAQEADHLYELLVDFSGYGTNNQAAAFVQDRWTVTPRLTVNAGLRWEQQDLSSSSGVVVAVGRTASGEIVRDPRGSFVMDDAWAPRVGVAWDPTGNSRSRVYASAGRFYEAIPVYMNVWSMAGTRDTDFDYYSTVEHTHDNWWNPNGSPVNGDWVRIGSNDTSDGRIPVDPRMKPEYELSYNLGFEKSWGPRWFGGARLVRRELHDVLEDHSVYDEQGNKVDYIISNIGTGDYASNFRTPQRLYEAIELYAQRRLFTRWQLVTSFTSSRARGDVDGFYDYAHPNLGTAPHTTLGIEQPIYETNSFGRLRSDRPYVFKVHSSYEFPFGLTVSEGLTYSAGTPYSAFAARNLTGGQARMYYLTPRGSAGRTPDIYSLDLHAAWRLQRVAGVIPSMIVDVFNATDAHRAVAVDQEYFYKGLPGYSAWLDPANRDENGLPKFNASLPKSPYFGKPIAYQPGRAIQAALKVQF
jgi:hypothetical protein